MDPLKFGLPLLSLASLASSACTDPIIGDWECTELDGEDMPYHYDYNYSGAYGDFDLRITTYLTMTIEDDLEGEAEFKVIWDAVGTEYLEPYGYHEEQRNDYDVTAEPSDKDEYDIELDPDDGDKIDLVCTLVDDTMECEDDDGVDFVFERD